MKFQTKIKYKDGRTDTLTHCTAEPEGKYLNNDTFKKFYTSLIENGYPEDVKKILQEFNPDSEIETITIEKITDEEKN